MASKNPPAAIISGAYFTASLMEKLVAGLRSHGWDDERVHSLGTQLGEVEMEHGVSAFIEAVAGKVCLRAFFVSVDHREIFCAWSSFKDLVLSACTAEATPARVGRYYDLPKDMTEAEIRKNLGEGHVFEDVSPFAAALAQMAKHQEGDKKGNLLNSGRANLFFARVGSKVVGVKVERPSGSHVWHGHAFYSKAAHRWRRGDRAFSAAAELES